VAVTFVTHHMFPSSSITPRVTPFRSRNVYKVANAMFEALLLSAKLHGSWRVLKLGPNPTLILVANYYTNIKSSLN
jgi:hypothetical protein